MYINTNVSALFAENALQQTGVRLSGLQQQLSTGYAINSPANNPSGLAISNLMTGELGGINAAIQNGNQASNLLQTANGGVQNDMQIVQQINQLAVQASNGTQTTQDQQDIQSQIKHLLQQLNSNQTSVNYNNRQLLNGNFGAQTANFTHTGTGGNKAITSIHLGADAGNATAGNYSVTVTESGSSSTTFYVNVLSSTGTTLGSVAINAATTGTTATAQFVNGTSTALSGMNGSFVVNFNPASVVADATAGYSAAATYSVTAAAPLQFQVGASQGNTINSALGKFNASTLGLSHINVVGQSGAQDAISLAKNALSMLTNAQGGIGAQLDQINYTVSNLQSETVNLQSSRSTIKDANMAQVSSQFAQEQVLQQTGLQALATAQQMPSLVLKLLS